MNQESIYDIINMQVQLKELKKNIMIYGTGTIAREVYEVLENKRYKIKCFLNKDLSYTNVVKNLREVKRIDDETITKEQKQNSTVIIASFNPYTDINKIIEDLISMNYRNIITFAELFDIFEYQFKDRLYLNTRKDFLKDKEAIINASNLWNDEKSNNLYKNIVKFRILKDYKYLLDKEPLEEQYFPKDIKKIYSSNAIRFIDCGAFDGDTINSLIKKSNSIESIVAFEPDLDNYNKLIKNATDFRKSEKVKEVSIFPCAVYSRSTQIKFNMSGSTGSNISDSGLNTVQCISIDESIGDFNPTYIKMDIEGSEYEAILGAKDTICKFKPNLAISLYHTPKDLYRIPMLIDSWKLGYEFYLRMYLYSSFDLVLYAVK